MIRSKILAIAAAGAVAFGGLAVAAPAGADTNADLALSCTGGRSLGKLNPGINFSGVQTKATTALFTDLTSVTVPKAKLGGNCTAKLGVGGRLAANGGKPGIPGAGAQTLALTPTTLSSVLNGYGSCNSAATPGTTGSADYPLNGLLTMKAAQTYVDSVTLLTKQYSTQAYISSNGFVAPHPDYIRLVGTGIKGIGAGATLSGEIYFDPIKKPLKGTDWDTDGLDGGLQVIPTTILGIPSYSAQTGYMFDALGGISCIVLGGNIALIEVGAGTTSLLGSINPNAGINLQLP